MLKRTVTLLLIALTCLCTLLTAACGSEGDAGSPQGAQSAASAEESGERFLNEPKNWGGETVTLLTHDTHAFSRCAVPEEQTSEPVNDAFFERRAKIGELYGIELQNRISPTPWDMAAIARSDIDSGMNEIQIYSIPLTSIAPLAAEGLLYDFNSIGNGYLHLDKEWWDQSIIRDLSIGGRLWFLAGDALVEDDEATWAVYFNKDIIQARGLESPYDLVRDGKWTIDKMHEMSQSAVYMDGNSMEFDHTAQDTWGTLVQSYDCYALMLGCGQKMIANEDGKLGLRVMEEENVNTFTKVMEFVLDETSTAVADFNGRWDAGIYDEEYRIFASGHSLFMPYTISTVSQPEMRDAEIHYGILPMPKRSELQEEYTTSVTCYWCEVLTVPTSNVDKLDVTCYALEAMAFYGKELVTPEYYSRTLKYKRFEDSDSEEMLDLIFRNRIYDIAGVFNVGNDSGNGMLGFYTGLLGSRKTEIASTWEAYEQHFETALNALVETLESNP